MTGKQVSVSFDLKFTFVRMFTVDYFTFRKKPQRQFHFSWSKPTNSCLVLVSADNFPVGNVFDFVQRKYPSWRDTARSKTFDHVTGNQKSSSSYGADKLKVNIVKQERDHN